MSKVHLADGSPGGIPKALCGWIAVVCTSIPDAVTCKKCRLKMAPQRGNPWRFKGQRLADLEAGLHGLASIVAGDYAGPESGLMRVHGRPLETRWASVSHALSEMVAMDTDGPGFASLSDPDRMQRMAGLTGGASTAERPAHPEDDLHAVRAAWRLAFEKLDPTPLSWEEARAAVLARYVGVHDVTGWRKLQPTELAERLLVERGYVASPKAIGKITRLVHERVYEYLRHRQMVPQRRQKMDSTDSDLQGWKEIASWLKCHVETAQRWTGLDDDPMPVRRFMGRVEASKAEIREWRMRRTKKSS